MGQARDLVARGAAHPGHGGAAERSLGVAVGVVGEDLLGDEALDLAQGAAGGDVVGVDQRLLAERSGDGNALADQAGAQGGERVGRGEAAAKGVERHGGLRKSFPEEMRGLGCEIIAVLCVETS